MSSLNQRAGHRAVFIRGKRYTILPAMSIDGIFTAEIMEGSCTKDLFQKFIIEKVVREDSKIHFCCEISAHPFIGTAHVAVPRTTMQ